MFGKKKPMNIEWTLCDTVLPPNDTEVQIIAYNKHTEEKFVTTCKFNCSKGWDVNYSNVYAWKFITDETERLLKEAKKKFKS